SVVDETEKIASQDHERQVAPSKRRVATLTTRLDQLKRSLYLGQIDQDFFVREKHLITEELVRLEDRLRVSANQNKRLNDQVIEIFEFAAQAPTVFRTASPQQKRQIALSLSSNFRLQDKKLKIKPEK